MKELSASEFDAEIASSQVTIVDLWAQWCGPCLALSPILGSLAEKYSTINVAKVNISDHPSIAKKLSVSSIPCLIVFKDGKEIDRSIGFKGKDALEDLFKKHS